MRSEVMAICAASRIRSREMPLCFDDPVPGLATKIVGERVEAFGLLLR